ncbi:MAG: rod shape-determining protein MreC [Treponemataceae bacterium]
MKRKISSNSFKLSLVVLVVLVVFSGIILGLSSGGFIISVKEVGFSAFSTIQHGTNSLFHGVTGIFSAVKELAELKTEYTKLVEKLENYEYLQRDNAEIRKENERLKNQLQISNDFEKKNYVARIIGRDPDSLYSSVTINKGSRQGIRKNMPVIALQNGDIGLVGKIVSVGPNTSMIMPIYDLHCSVSGRIQHTRDVGLVEGQGSDNAPLRMRYIKRKVRDELQYGDVIVTSGENGNYIADIPIGSINNITAVDYDNSLIIELVPVVDFSRLENVMVIDLKQDNK